MAETPVPYMLVGGPYDGMGGALEPSEPTPPALYLKCEHYTWPGGGEYGRICGHKQPVDGGMRYALREDGMPLTYQYDHPAEGTA